MKKEIIKPSNSYKINLPLTFEVFEILDKDIDMSNFVYISPIVDSFSFESAKYDDYKLREYVDLEKINYDLLYFYFDYKDVPIKQLSVRKKIILNLCTLIKKYDCVIFSLEALSISTIDYLILFSKELVSKHMDKAIILFNFSTNKKEFKEIEIEIL